MVYFSKDIHKLVKKRTKNLVLGGISIPESKYSVVAHSDGDLIVHTLISVLLSAMNLQTIGEIFSDTDKKTRNQSSIAMLNTILNYEQFKKLKINNIDFTVVCEKIMLKSHIKSITLNLQNILKTNNITLKATRFENKRSKMIECYCVLSTTSI